MQNSGLPPDLITQIMDVVYYAIAAAVGWFTKWLTGSKKERPQK